MCVKLQKDCRMTKRALETLLAHRERRSCGQNALFHLDEIEVFWREISAWRCAVGQDERLPDASFSVVGVRSLAGSIGLFSIALSKGNTPEAEYAT
jgi:hypothetical protein